jgi:uroporphyrinogen-III synthase
MLDKLGESCLFVPTQGEDSESLLADPILQNIAGQTIVIMKGASDAGGRTLLADSLVKRGAMVVGIVCYQRASMTMSLKRRAALRWAIHHATHVIAGSVETLDALDENGDGLLKRVAHLLVPHARIAAVAKKRGVKVVSVVSLDDNKLVNQLSKLND